MSWIRDSKQRQLKKSASKPFTTHGNTRRGIPRQGPRMDQGTCMVCGNFYQEQAPYRQDATFKALPHLNNEEGRLVCGMKQRLSVVVPGGPISR
jgi:hypothetical protein